MHQADHWYYCPEPEGDEQHGGGEGENHCPALLTRN